MSDCENCERLRKCPVCEKTDTDGLEACADCYNHQISVGGRLRRERDEAVNTVEMLTAPEDEGGGAAGFIESLRTKLAAAHGLIKRANGLIEVVVHARHRLPLTPAADAALLALNSDLDSHLAGGGEEERCLLDNAIVSVPEKPEEPVCGTCGWTREDYRRAVKEGVTLFNCPACGKPDSITEDAEAFNNAVHRSRAKWAKENEFGADAGEEE